MTPENRANAWRLVQELKTDGQTNLWDGLRMALEMAKAAVSQNCSIMLLTDGLPNIEPPRGHCPTLKRYLAEAPDLHCEISTFGFGYNLESALLRDIAALGRGSYAFIPDSGFVGTCFVNAAANVLSTAAAAATLEVKPLNGAQLVGPLVEVKCNGNQDGMTIALPFLQYGQSKDILMRVSLGPDSSLPQVSVALCIGGSSYTAESSFCQPSSPEAAELHSHHARLLLVNMLEEAEDKLAKAGNETSEQHKALESAQASIAQLVAGIAGPQNQGGSQLVQGMLEDLTGQVSSTFSRSRPIA